jgi:hypothetical protein
MSTMMNPQIVLACSRRASAASSHIRNTMSIRCMSASAKVWVNKETRVICQGFTGKQVRHVSCCSCYSPFCCAFVVSSPLRITHSELTNDHQNQH